ncbi:MAG: hypothetical protein U0790_02545 [Isosphaeraceae bacterium]
MANRAGEAELTAEQLRAIGALSGSGSGPAGLDDLDAGAVADWMAFDAGFVAGLNRARSYRAERLRAEVRSLASDAAAVLRELVTGPDVPPAVRLRASLAILQAAEALKPDQIGPTSARGVQATMAHRALLESLGG